MRTAGDHSVRTRVPVWVLEQSRRLGMSEDELLRSYPTLRAEDLVNAWAYLTGMLIRVNRPNRAGGEKSELRPAG